MKQVWIGIFTVVLATLASGCNATMKSEAKSLATEQITYTADGQTLHGYLAYDASIKGKRPAVLVVHEWWGLNDYARQRAEMLAGLGYTALAIDMYGDGKTADHPKQAGEFATAVRQNWAQGKERFMAALQTLRQQPSVDPDQIAAIGYCFGGGVVLQMAREGADLDGVASFHGSLAPMGQKAEPGEVEARVLVLHGAKDKFVSDEQLQAFKQEMENAGVGYELVVYPNATHSFTNPQADQFAEKFGLPLGYDVEADQQSWEKLQAFLKEIFSSK